MPERIGLISDVHANIHALEVVLAELEKEGVSRIIHAGDIVDYNAFPNEAISVFRERGIINIQGNHDRAALDGDTSRWNAYAVHTSLWTRKILTPGSMEYLRGLKESLSLEIGGIRIAVHHGSPADPDEYIEEEDASPSLLRQAKARILVLGHTHRPFVAEFPEGTIINPGSVGQPRDGNWKASFALLTADDSGGFAIELRRLEYDVEGAQKACRKAGFPERLIDFLGTGG